MGGVMAWTLIIYIFAGPWATSDSVTVAATPMATQEICMQAGKDLDSLVSGSKKEVRFVCVRNQ